MSTVVGAWPLAADGLVFVVAVVVCTWVASLVRRDASLVDRTWSVMIAGAAVVYVEGSVGGGDALRRAWLLGLVLTWGVRLSAYVTWRNWGHGEDRRYQAIRARNQPHFALKSLVYVFLLQAILAWLVSAPALVVSLGARPIGGLDVLGIAVAVVGLVFEIVGDAQLARFKSDPANHGRALDRGLWRYTRHPNYFGEACFWWGVWLLALGAGGLAGAWTVVAPVVMTVLLLKVSGVALLEQDIAERRPGYRDYVARTNAFFPGPARRR